MKYLSENFRKINILTLNFVNNFVNKFLSSWYLGWIYLVIGAIYPRNMNQIRAGAPRPCLSCYGLLLVKIYFLMWKYLCSMYGLNEIRTILYRKYMRSCTIIYRVFQQRHCFSILNETHILDKSWKWIICIDLIFNVTPQEIV